MKKYLPALAVIFAAFLWSFDGFIRQNLFALPSFLIVSLELCYWRNIIFPITHQGVEGSFFSRPAGMDIRFVDKYFRRLFSALFSIRKP
jgi:hypothetical protein